MKFRYGMWFVAVLGSILLGSVGAWTQTQPMRKQSDPTVAAKSNTCTENAAGEVTCPPPGEGNNDILLGRHKLSEASDLAYMNPDLTNNNDKLQMKVTQFYTGGNDPGYKNENFISSSNLLNVGGPANISTSNYTPLPQQTRSARLFDLPHDQLITVGRNADSNSLAIFNGDKVIWKLDRNQGSYHKLQMAVGDVTGDGYDDVIVMNDYTIRVLTAVDVENPSLGLKLIAQQNLCASGPCTNLQPESQPVVADFGGDGVPVLAWVGGHMGGAAFTAGDQWVYFARICIKGNPSGYCSSQDKSFISISPNVIRLGYAGKGQYCTATSALAAGQFFMGVNFTPSKESMARQLLVARTRTQNTGNEDNRKCAVDLSDYSFGPNPKLEPEEKQKVFAGNRKVYALVYLVSDRLNWWGNQDQAVLALDGKAINNKSVERRNVTLVTFSNSGQMSFATSKELGGVDQRWHIEGLATGRFNNDNRNADNFNPRIAVLGAGFNVTYPYAQNENFRISFLHPENPALGQWTPILDETYAGGRSRRYPDFTYLVGNNLLQAGDFQGRSVRLGNPTIARIDSYFQPRAIAPIPPMMVDLVPWGDDGTPKVVNFSAIPAVFKSKFNTTVSDTNQSSTQSTTGSSIAEEHAFKGTVGYVVPKTTAGVVASGGYAHEYTETNTVSHNYDTYKLSAFDVSLATNLQDVVWFSESNLNLFYYPIIGAKLCPEDNPGCPADEQSPAYVEFAGPSKDSNRYADTNADPWYQPVQQPFQVFSYPRTDEQLEEGLGFPVGLEELASSQTFYTSNGIVGTYGARWENQGTNASSVGTTTEITNSGNWSVTAGTQDWKKLNGFGASVEYNGSFGASTSTRDVALNSTKLGQSSGISGTLPSTFRASELAHLQYSFTPQVFGEAPRPDGDASKVSGVDISTKGILLGTFLADATTSGGGSYWNSEASPYNAQTGHIDIAINHPSRWTFGTRKYDHGAPKLAFECLRTEGVFYQCAYENKPIQTDNTWDISYYHMRGLSITQDVPYGSQVIDTTQGRTIYLGARIYNYSFKPMPRGSTLHVQFYRQPWKGTTPTGPAVLLNRGAKEIVRDDNGTPVHIPPYGAESPNWVIARTSFNTTGLAGDYVFWVVAWAEDANNHLVPEVVDHGLSAIPGDLPYIGDAPLQWVDVNYPSDGAKSGETSFTNNVGFFRQLFYVAPGRPSLPDRHVLFRQLEIEDATVTPIPEQSGTYAVSADVMALKGPATGVLATAADLTAAGAQPFDMELIPNIDANHTERAELVYAPETCGLKHLEIEVSGSHSGSVTRRVNLKVPCGELTR